MTWCVPNHSKDATANTVCKKSHWWMNPWCCCGLTTSSYLGKTPYFLTLYQFMRWTLSIPTMGSVIVNLSLLEQIFITPEVVAHKCQPTNFCVHWPIKMASENLRENRLDTEEVGRNGDLKTPPSKVTSTWVTSQWVPFCISDSYLLCFEKSHF